MSVIAEWKLNINYLKKNSRNPLIRMGLSTLGQIYRCIKAPIRLLINPDYRAIIDSKIFRPKSLHQTTTLTFLNRYPEIFLASMQSIPHDPQTRILSYGCSTGEEVESLRQYYPEATIIGADINRHCLKICRSKKLDKKIEFIFSDQAELKENGPYDAIFCMAVFQREPHKVHALDLKNINHMYPFEKFEEQVSQLDKLLNPGGLLVIHFTQYLFTDTSIASKYEPFTDVSQKNYGLPVFDKQGDRLDRSVVPLSMYRKLAAE